MNNRLRNILSYFSLSHLVLIPQILCTYFFYALLAGNSLSLALPRAGVTLRLLASDRQSLAMSQTTVAADILESSNILRYLSIFGGK